MKNIGIICLIALASAGAFAQSPASTGIQFFQGTWSEALTAAKQQNKLLFVDVYADWCGPCKMMAANTFTDPKVGELYNQSFINVKLNGEKGDGPALAARWKVTAYPTLLYVNAFGDVVYTVMGYMPPADFLVAGQKAAALGEKAKPARAGVAPGSDEVLTQALDLMRAGEGYGETAAQFFEAQRDRDLLTQRGWEAIAALTTDPGSREFALLLDKYPTFVKIAGSVAVQQKIAAVLLSAWDEALQTEDAAAQEKVMTVAKQAPDNGQMAQRLQMERFKFLKDSEAYAEAAVQYFTTYTITDTAQLNDAVNQFVVNGVGQDKLIFADRWVRQSQALANSYHVHILYARLNAKRGEYFKAMGEAKQAAQFPGITAEQQAAALALVREIHAQIP